MKKLYGWALVLGTTALLAGSVFLAVVGGVAVAVGVSMLDDDS